jgi:hypothetical protein
VYNTTLLNTHLKVNITTTWNWPNEKCLIRRIMLRIFLNRVQMPITIYVILLYVIFFFDMHKSYLYNNIGYCSFVFLWAHVYAQYSSVYETGLYFICILLDKLCNTNKLKTTMTKKMRCPDDAKKFFWGKYTTFNVISKNEDVVL